MFDNLYEMLKKYVGCGLNFTNRFRIRKSNVKTKEEGCGTAKHFDNICSHSSNAFIYNVFKLLRKLILLMKVAVSMIYLWDRKKCWQSQSFTNINGRNCDSCLYSAKIKGCRKH